MKVHQLEKILRRLHPDAEIRILHKAVGEEIVDVQCTEHCAYLRFSTESSVDRESGKKIRIQPLGM